MSSGKQRERRKASSRQRARSLARSSWRPRTDDDELVPSGTVQPRHSVKLVVGVSALGRGTPWADRAGFVTGSLAMDDLIASSGVAYRALCNPSFM
jgi:hypothetical protein